MLTVDLEEMLVEASTVSERCAAHAPRSLRIPALFGAVRLPDRFGGFLADLSDYHSAPSAISALRKGVARYEDMTRILRRKT